MNIVVLKSDEDYLLGDCDNSCSYGHLCVCKTILGMTNAGQGMYDFGFTKCVLCMRRDYSRDYSVTNRFPPYRVVADNYPREWLLDGAFIRFNKNDYAVSGDRTIIQMVDKYEKSPVSWISTMYETGVSKVPVESTRWFMAVCTTENCKQTIHSYIDEHRAIGIDKSYMDLSTNTVKCLFCHKGLTYVDDVNGIVTYNNQHYSRCRFCHTIVNHDNGVALQICTTCRKLNQEEQKLLERVCMHCGNTVPVNKKGGSQTIIVRGTDGTIKEYFLCRHHRIKNISATEIYDQTHIESIVFNHT